MKTKKNQSAAEATQNLSTAARLEAILSEIGDTELRSDLAVRFWVANPLQLCRTIRSLELPIAVQSKLLSLKVGMPPTHKGTDLSVLVERAAQDFWTGLGAERR